MAQFIPLAYWSQLVCFLFKFELLQLSKFSWFNVALWLSRNPMTSIVRRWWWTCDSPWGIPSQNLNLQLMCGSRWRAASQYRNVEPGANVGVKQQRIVRLLKQRRKVVWEPSLIFSDKYKKQAARIIGQFLLNDKCLGSKNENRKCCFTWRRIKRKITFHRGVCELFVLLRRCSVLFLYVATSWCLMLRRQVSLQRFLCNQRQP